MAQMPHWIGLTKGIPLVWEPAATSSCSNPCTLVVQVCSLSTLRASATHFMSFFDWVAVLGNVSEAVRRGLLLSSSLGRKYVGVLMFLLPVRSGGREESRSKAGISVAQKLPTPMDR